MQFLQEFANSALGQMVIPILVVVLVAAIILKAAKGCIKFLICVILIAGLIIYVIPMIPGVM